MVKSDTNDGFFSQVPPDECPSSSILTTVFAPMGKRLLRSLKASNRYSEGYLASLETTVAMAALYAEEQAWSDVQEITTEHIEDYLSYLQDRVRWFGERTYAEPRKLSKGLINAQ